MNLNLKITENKPYIKVFNSFPVSIGRVKGNTLVFHSLKMSRFHAEIREENGKLILFDLKSNSGTFVNEKPIDKIELKYGSTFKIDKIIFEVLDQETSENEKLKEISQKNNSIKKSDNSIPADNSTQIIEEDNNKTKIVFEDKITENPIIVSQNQAEKLKFTIPEGESSVGRLKNNDFVVDLPSVSRRHASFSFNDNLLTVADLQSKNSTYVNGKKNQKAQPIKHGDIIKFGLCEFKVDWSIERKNNNNFDSENDKKSGNYTEILPHNFSVDEPINLPIFKKKSNQMVVIGTIFAIVAVISIGILLMLRNPSPPILPIETWAEKVDYELESKKDEIIIIINKDNKNNLEIINNNIDKTIRIISDTKKTKTSIQTEAQNKNWLETSQYEDLLDESETLIKKAEVLKQNLNNQKNEIIISFKKKLLKNKKDINNHISKTTNFIRKAKENKNINYCDEAVKALQSASEQFICLTSDFNKIKKYTTDNISSYINVNKYNSNYKDFKNKIETQRNEIKNFEKSKKEKQKLKIFEDNIEELENCHEYEEAIDEINKALEFINGKTTFLTEKNDLSKKRAELEKKKKRKEELKKAYKIAKRALKISPIIGKQDLRKIINNFKDVKELETYKKAKSELKNLQ